MVTREDATKELLEIAGVPEERIVLMSKFSPVPYAEKLLEENKFLFDNYKRFWRYDYQEGIWKEDGEMFIRHKLRLKLLGEEQQKKNYTDEVVSYIKDCSWSEKNVSNPPENIIAFQNCLYDVDTEEILDFTPEYFITIKIPVEIDSQFIECPKIDAFFDDVVGEYKQTLYELIAYTLLRGYPYQKFFILFGKGNNGKSVFLNLIRRFVGIDNVSNETPQNLVSNRFSRGNLWNKLANIGSDIPYVSLDNTNIMKELTGEDYTNCERKFKEPFPFRNYAKLIWSANELPQVNDKTYAFYRRVYIVGFHNDIQSPDPNILNKITNKEEMSGLAWVCLKLLKELKKKDYKFTYNPSVKEMEQMYEDLSNPLNKFLRETTLEERNGKVERWEFQDKFMKWLRDNGFRIWGVREINISMKDRFREGKVAIEVEEYDEIQKKFVKQVKWHRTWEGLEWNRVEQKEP